jgi:hypothetical protein
MDKLSATEQLPVDGIKMSLNDEGQIAIEIWRQGKRSAAGVVAPVDAMTMAKDLAALATQAAASRAHTKAKRRKVGATLAGMGADASTPTAGTKRAPRRKTRQRPS